MSDYTDEQIYAAADIAVAKTSPAYKNVEEHFLRAFLDAFPTQQDNWEACTFEEIRKGDRVKRVLDLNDGETLIKEGVADYLEDTSKWISSGGMAIASNGWIPEGAGTVTLYRIPAPVVRPDPEEHPVILVHAFDGDQMPEGTYASITQNQAHSYVYELVPGDGTHPIRTRPDAIDEWEPAKVVPSNYVSHTCKETTHA